MLQKLVLLVLSRALAIEYGGEGIRVNVIAPDTIMIDILRSINQDELKEFYKNIPQGFIGNVSDVSGAIIKAYYLTGQVISPN